ARTPRSGQRERGSGDPDVQRFLRTATAFTKTIDFYEEFWSLHCLCFVLSMQAAIKITNPDRSVLEVNVAVCPERTFLSFRLSTALGVSKESVVNGVGFELHLSIDVSYRCSARGPIG